MSDTAPSPPALFVAPGPRPVVDGMSVVADAAGTAGAFGLADGTVPTGYSPPLHVHHQEDEAFYVLDGTIDFVCDGERFRGEAGAFVFLPRGRPHTFIGISDPPARAIVLFVPGGLEQMAVPDEPERRQAVLRERGIEVVGAPLSA